MLLVRVYHLLLGWWWEIFTACEKNSRVNQERKRNMAKNMTRKGLAVGIAATFVASGLAGLPANADEATLTLEPNAGTGFTTITGSTFELETGIPSSIPSSNWAQIKYRVQNDSLVSVTAAATTDGTSGGTDSAFQYGTASAATGGGITGGTPDTTDVTDDDFVIAPVAVDKILIGETSTMTLTVGDAAPTALSVTAWLDVNGNNTIDTGEAYSPTQVVTFAAPSSVTGTVTMAALQAGDETLTATVEFAGGVNVRQIDDGDLLVQFGTVSSAGVFASIPSFALTSAGTEAEDNDGTTSTTVTAKDVVTSNPEGNNVVWNSTLSRYEAVFNPFDIIGTNAGNDNFTALAAQKYGAKLFLDHDNGGSPDVDDASDQEGSTSVVTVGAAATDYTVTYNVVNSAGAVTTTVGEDDNGSTAATTVTTAQGSQEDMVASMKSSSSSAGATSEGGTFRVFVGTDVTVPVGVKDVSVKATFAHNTGLTLTDGVTVDGLSVYNGQSRTITATTDASGVATFAIAATGAEAGDIMDITLSVNGVTPAAGVDGQITWAVSDYEIYATNDLSGNGGVAISSGDTFTMDYTVLDQFGAAPPNGAYRVVVQDLADSNRTRTTAADFAYAAPIVDGKASVEITDDGVGNGTYSLEAFWALTAVGTAGSDADDTVETAVSVVTDPSVTVVTLDAMETDHYGSAQLNDANSDGDYSDAGDTDNRNKLVLETESIYTYIANTAGNSETAPDLTSGLEVTIEGTVTNAAGAAVPYAEVTLTAPKFLFVTNSNYSLGSITTVASSTGTFSVNVYSQSGGVNNIVVTSGSGSATQSLTYAGAVSGAASDFTVTTPGASEPGRTVDVTINVSDVNGNAVEAASVTLSSTGPGYLINTSGTTLSDGTFTTKLLLGANDSGTAVIKAVMTIDGEEVIKTSSVVVGVGAVAESSKKVNAGSFKGYVAVYAKGYVGQRLSAKIGNDWVIVPSLASNFERVTDFTGAGVDIAVRIYIDRVLVDTINLTTK